MLTTTHPDGPRLLADIGGTNARFALEPACLLYTSPSPRD